MQSSKGWNRVLGPSDHLLSDASFLDLFLDRFRLLLIVSYDILNVHLVLSCVSRGQIDQLFDVWMRGDWFVSIFLVQLDQVRFYICCLKLLTGRHMAQRVINRLLIAHFAQGRSDTLFNFLTVIVLPCLSWRFRHLRGIFWSSVRWNMLCLDCINGYWISTAVDGRFSHWNWWVWCACCGNQRACAIAPSCCVHQQLWFLSRSEDRRRTEASRRHDGGSSFVLRVLDFKWDWESIRVRAIVWTLFVRPEHVHEVGVPSQELII